MYPAIRQLTINISKSWTKYFTMLSGLYISLALLAPLLLIANAQQIANKLYGAYSLFCHQNPYKSWYLSTSTRPMGLNISSSFNILNEVPFGIIIDSSKFIGSSELGWKTALCHRCTAIYLTAFTASLLYHILKVRGIHIPILHPHMYFAVGLLPIAIHTMITPQPESSFIRSIVSDSHMIRTITGGLFGTMSIWFAFPEIDHYSQKYVSNYSKSRYYSQSVNPYDI